MDNNQLIAKIFYTIVVFLCFRHSFICYKFWRKGFGAYTGIPARNLNYLFKSSLRGIQFISPKEKPTSFEKRALLINVPISLFMALFILVWWILDIKLF